jgi:hypothetical protein
MAKYVKIYEVFISSPSDVPSERDCVEEAIEEVSRLVGARNNYKISTLRWERDVSSQIGGRPQEIINNQIGDAYDIFIGILCGRFGQETSEYNSGTEEEFFKAYERCENEASGPEILFYFKDPRKSTAPLDPDQLLKVFEFRKKISLLGIYEEFETLETLKTKVMAAIIKAIERIQKAEGDGERHDIRVVQGEPLNSVTGNALTKIGDFDEDLGLLDLSEMVFTAIDSFTSNLNTITSATTKLGARMTSQTGELNNLKKTGDARQDQKAVKGVIEKVAAEMQRYSQILDRTTPDARRDFSSALRFMQHAIIISHQDGMSDADDVVSFLNMLDEFYVTLSVARNQIADFQEVILSTPRMTSKLNQAKRRTLKSGGDLLEFISEACEGIRAAQNAIRQ